MLRGVGWDGAGAPPYWLWTQVLRGIGPGRNPSRSARRAGLLAGPRQRRGRIGAGRGGRPVPAVRRGRHRAAPAGRDAPLVVVLDDLQWADDPSLRLLEFVATQLAGVRGPGPRRVPRHRGRRGAAPDGRAGAAARSARAGRDRRPDDRRGRVPPVGRAGGGGVAALRRQPALRPRADPAGPRPRRMGSDGRHGSLPIPDSVRETLAERLNRVSPPCADVLAVVACSGLDVQLDVVARVCELPSDTVVDLLDEAMRATGDRVRRARAARIAHDLFRDAILASSPPPGEPSCTRPPGGRCWTWPAAPSVHDLSTVGGAARLAAHFMAAGPACADEARRYSVAAAREATARLGHDDAAVHYENALRLGPDGSADIELLLALAAARDRAGDAPAARHQYARAAEAARAAADATALARAALGVHDLGSRAGADVREVTDLLTEAADRLAARAPDRARCRAAVAGVGRARPDLPPRDGGGRRPASPRCRGRGGRAGRRSRRPGHPGDRAARRTRRRVATRQRRRAAEAGHGDGRRGAALGRPGPGRRGHPAARCCPYRTRRPGRPGRTRRLHRTGRQPRPRPRSLAGTEPACHAGRDGRSRRRGDRARRRRGGTRRRPSASRTRSVATARCAARWAPSARPYPGRRAATRHRSAVADVPPAARLDRRLQRRT